VPDSRPRILFYSHDSFGLGHLRRCRAIAQALSAYRPELSILIITGSPIVGAFTFSPQVDFVRVPGVVKLGNENYEPLDPALSIEDLTAMRSAIILQTAKSFAPDIFIVDKEPLGLRGEVGATLKMLKSLNKQLVLGLRDVMDDPRQLAGEWERKRALPAVESLYDHIWVYGLEAICDPLEGVPVSAAARGKTRFTGYLRREFAPSGALPPASAANGEPYILVTTGGGGDGVALVDGVLAAYEADLSIPVKAKIILGPFMGSASQSGFMERVARLGNVAAASFEASIEPLMEKAVGVVAMGGYNTFCEILSFDKPALIVPRTSPRAEQFIRASRAADLGLVRMLLPDEAAAPAAMAAALKALPAQPRPSSAPVPGILDGLDVINGLVDEYLAAPARRRPSLALVGGGA